MRDEPETADGARSARRGDSAPVSSAPHRDPGSAWFDDPEHPDEAAREALTHQSDPYDYGAPTGPDTGSEPDPDDEPLLLDRELLARELAADRARQANGFEPTAEVPRTPASWPASGPTRPGAHDPVPPGRLAGSQPAPAPPPPGAGPSPLPEPTAPTATRLTPSSRNRELVPSVAPFTAPTAVVSPAPRLEQALDAAYRWRTILGLGLAGLVTLGVVVAYRPAGDEASTTAASATDPNRDSTLDGGIEDAPTTGDPATIDPADDGADQQLDGGLGDDSTTTSVDEIDPTSSAEPSPTSGAPATTPPAPAGPASSTAPSTDPAPDPTPGTEATTAPSTTSTTAPQATTTAAPVEAAVRQSEDGNLIAPAVVRDQHAGFTGSGYVGDLITTGAGVTVKVESISNGTIGYTVRYATPPAGPAGDRTLTLSVNGKTVETVVFPSTGGADSWSTVTGTVALTQGPVDLTLSVGAGDTGWVNIDYLSLP